MRAMPSVLPPGANGMMILTGFCGQPWDCAGWVEPRAARMANNTANTFRVCIMQSRWQPILVIIAFYCTL
jgi:hypothetical protein